MDNAQTLNETNAAEIAQMQNLIKQMSEEKENLKKQLDDSNLKVEHFKICGAGFEENYNLLNSKAPELEKENSEIPELKILIQQMTETQENLEKQLSESNLKFEKLMDYAVKFE